MKTWNNKSNRRKEKDERKSLIKLDAKQKNMQYLTLMEL